MNVGIFVASLGSASVEFFETAAIAYAIFRSGYPREAIWGTITGLMGVGIVSALMGTGLQYIPIRILQVAIGLVLLWFGWGWYKKSILRQARHKRAGWITNPLESEGIALETKRNQFSQLNFLVMTKSAAIEALEVALVVITLGLASGTWIEAIAGAGLALLLTVAVVAMLHGYLLTVPDVWLKLSAGVMLLSYGTFWLAEGLGFASPLGEFALPILIGFYGGISLFAIRQLQTQ
ncbi:COG4280 domain-containing protein [Nostoc sp. TCL240-02]|uniref:COG4280 domain-containing protein n=1 Tax=Nostoc sp. TCL240-02 TaxID=2572090 RepID=UPI00157FA4EE|nr:hypothetical protein [Nostoc sp. TCL240-02]QKQ73159.1 hypothetical protein FBB35_07025 [Nostoc sp. TCL240-02]